MVSFTRGEFTGEAFCQARARLPLEVLRKLNKQMSQAVMERAPADALLRQAIIDKRVAA